MPGVCRDRSPHLNVDETKQRDYLMVAAVVLGKDLTSARAVVQDLLKPGQHHLHMKDEADGRKETIAKALAAADLAQRSMTRADDTAPRRLRGPPVYPRL